MAMNYARFEGPHAKPHANTRLHSEVYGSAFYGHITASTPTGPSSNPATAVVAQKEVLRNAVVAVQKGFGWGCGSDCTKGMRLGQWSPLHKSLQNTCDWICCILGACCTCHRHRDDTSIFRRKGTDAPPDARVQVGACLGESKGRTRKWSHNLCSSRIW